MPWRNGCIERLGKELLRVFRATLSEIQLPHDPWPDLVGMAQSAQNNSPSIHRKKFAPVPIFAGQDAQNRATAFGKTSTGRAVTIKSLRKKRH